MSIEVDGVKQLSRVLQKLEGVRDVFDVRRDTPIRADGPANGLPATT
jgi:hypothetical protein